jgi:hypothetical protein
MGTNCRRFIVTLMTGLISGLMLGLMLGLMAFASLARAQSGDGAGERYEAPPLLPELRAGFRATPEAREYAVFCPGVRIRGLGDLEFQPMETRLACGDPANDAIGIPWASIPPTQAAVFLRSFLQSRGHHQPNFVQDGDWLFVDVGPLSRLARFRIRGGPETWNPPRRRLVQGLNLTPSLLNDLESWTLDQIKNEGYACAEASGRADPVSGEALVTLQPGGAKFIANIENTGDTGLSDAALDRYNAFRMGDLYRERLLTLTQRRITEDGFLQGISLRPRCEPGYQLTITRDVVLGPSRVVRIGVGGSTDEGARVRGILRQNRIGESASSAQVRLNLTYLREEINRQILDANYRWYYSQGEERSFLEPLVIFRHDATVSYAEESAEFKAMHGWNREFLNGQFEILTGPTLLTTRRLRGAGVGESSLIFAEATGRWMSHDFEYFVTSPREGLFVESDLVLTRRDWGADFTAQRIRLTGQKLWNLLHYDPPLMILGLRFQLSSIFSDEENLRTRIPVRFLTFLGGDRDLRGFTLQSLPRSGLGALSGASVGVELRFHRVIYRRADAFFFLDGGVLGNQNFDLQSPYFLAPGTGLRWESPFGVFRAFVAGGFAIDETPGGAPYGVNWRVGLTYGEEF